MKALLQHRDAPGALGPDIALRRRRHEASLLSGHLLFSHFILEFTCLY